MPPYELKRPMQPSPPPSEDATKEIESIKGIVQRYFRVYETKLSLDAVQFHCEVDLTLLEENFNRLRSELGMKGYTPVITYQRGEHTITVGKIPPAKARGMWLNLAFLAFTFVTTIFAGMYLWTGYSGISVDQFFSSENIVMGTLTFALPLMAILGIHEMGHYYAAKRHGVPASLPFFIPGPPPLGTFGAFISIRGPIPDRKTLFNLGVAGPICGFLATIPIAIIGLMLTTSGAKPIPIETGGLDSIQMPLIYDFIGLFLPASGDYLLHPMAMAGWVGFLVTAINLLPAGSLDGGHIARAVLGPNSKYASWAALIAMFVIGWIWYIGWMFFGLLILFLGVDHPPPLNDITPLRADKKMIGAAMVAMLVTSFVVIPFENIPPDYSFDAELIGSDIANVSLGLNHTFTIMIYSTGNLNNTIVFELQPATLKDELSITVEYLSSKPDTDWYPSQNSFEAALPVNSTTAANLTISAKVAFALGKDVNGTIVLSALSDSATSRSIPIHVHEIAGNISYAISPSSASMGANQTKNFSLNVSSTYPSAVALQITVIAPAAWSAWIYSNSSLNATNRIAATVGPLSNLTCTIVVQSPMTATSGDAVVVNVEIRYIGTQEIKSTDIQINVV